MTRSNSLRKAAFRKCWRRCSRRVPATVLTSMPLRLARCEPGKFVNIPNRSAHIMSITDEALRGLCVCSGNQRAGLELCSIISGSWLRSPVWYGFTEVTWNRSAGKTIPWYRECCRSVVAVMVWCFWEARCARDGFGPDASAYIPLSKNIHLNQHVRGEEILRERSQRRERAAVTM
jgi:hypothetical protein